MGLAGGMCPSLLCSSTVHKLTIAQPSKNLFSISPPAAVNINQVHHVPHTGMLMVAYEASEIGGYYCPAVCLSFHVCLCFSHLCHNSWGPPRDGHPSSRTSQKSSTCSTAPMAPQDNGRTTNSSAETKSMRTSYSLHGTLLEKKTE